MVPSFHKLLAIICVMAAMAAITSCTQIESENDELSKSEPIAGQYSMTSSATIISIDDNASTMTCDIELDRDGDGIAESLHRAVVSYEFAHPRVNVGEFNAGDRICMRYQWIYLPNPPSEIGALSIEKID